MIAIVNYNSSNLTSVKNALDFLRHDSVITSDPREIAKADKIILPGVGAFGYGMENLKKWGLEEVLTEQVIKNKKPFLGICLGMQLICKKSYEEGEFQGLGWIDGEVVRFNLEDKKLPVPHVGWNNVACNPASPIFKDTNPQQTFYFVHSYYCDVKNRDLVTGWCDYGIMFPAALQKDNIYAVQFHPEKSQTEGLEILRKFAEL